MLSGALKPADAAKILGVRTQTVRVMIKRGDITAIKMGSRWYIPMKSLGDFIDEDDLRQRFREIRNDK